MIIKKLATASFLVLLLAFSTIAFAADDASTAYRKLRDVSVPKISTPTVVEVPFSETNLERYDFLVYNKTTKNFEPSLLLMDTTKANFRVSIVDSNSGAAVSGAGMVIDGDENSYVELPVSGDRVSSAKIVIDSDTVMTTNSLSLLLDNYVALPKTISIQAGSGDNLKTVLATKEVGSQSVYFPQTAANRFVINLTYSQPLRITELRLSNLANQAQLYRLRFLAQPNNEYSVYFDPDRRVSVTTGERGNLYDNNDVLKLAASMPKTNPSYIIADTDGDKIPDVRDNCVSIANTDQVDINNNGRGDVCDDFDKDGVINSKDNCPDLPNQNQIDDDGDKIGDVCDGEESRVTEKYKWLPWLGIVGAFIVVVGLFSYTVVSMRKKEDLPPQN
jgi:hypothetical protein